VEIDGNPMKGLDRESLGRNIFHLAGLVLPFTYLRAGRDSALLLAAFLLAVFCAFEILRRAGIPFILTFIERFLKKDETRRPSGSFFFVTGSLITILLFPDRAAIASLCVLSVSDPLASFGGRVAGRIRIGFGGKSLEGALVFFISSFLILLLFSFQIPIALVASLGATATELFSSKLLDDNLWIPVITALALTVLT
jgi:dolichol kinase